jgi:hypothetical protein
MRKKSCTDGLRLWIQSWGSELKERAIICGSYADSRQFIGEDQKRSVTYEAANQPEVAQAVSPSASIETKSACARATASSLGAALKRSCG